MTAVRRGVAGAVLVLLCLGVLAALASPPFLSADESAHAAYALDVMDGRLPTTREIVEVELPGQRPTRKFVANHPPLFYAVVGPVLAWGRDSDHALAGIRAARLFSVVLAGATVVMTALIAGMVVRRRREAVMILAAGLAASVPSFVSTAAVIHNDMLAVAASTLALLGVVATITDRPRAWNVACACLGVGITLATRLSGAGMVALLCVGLGLAAVVRLPGSNAWRWARGAVLGAAPLVTAAVMAGWFYLRNRRIYGDLAGITHNRRVGGRVDEHTPLSWATDLETIPDLLTRVENGGPWDDAQYFGWWDRKLLVAVVAVLLVGAVVGVRSVWARRDSDLGRVLLVGLMVVIPLGCFVQLAGYVAQTGSPHPRYLFGVLPIVAVAVAGCCLAFHRWWGVVVGAVVLAFQAWLAVTTEGRWINIRSGSDPAGPFRQLHDSLEQADVPLPSFVLAVLLAGVVAGLVLQVQAMLATTRSPAEPVEAAVPRPRAVAPAMIS